MHIEFLVEGTSDEKLLASLLPKILGNNGENHFWRIHPHQGKGKIPKDFKSSDPRNPTLLGRLPFILKGLGNSPGIDAVVILIDTDTEDCKIFLGKMNDFVESVVPRPKTLIRLAIEESEAWYLGDKIALLEAYPNINLKTIKNYQQDSVCGTWEVLAASLHSGDKHKGEWAEKIGPHLDPSRNRSPSFQKFCSGLRRLVAEAEVT